MTILQNIQRTLKAQQQQNKKYIYDLKMSQRP